MSRQFLISRSDRKISMAIQEEIINKKKREILEKQKTAELVKVVTSKMTSPACSSEQQPESSSSGLRNSFNNDGSFLEKFKKVAEAAKLNLKEDPDNEMDENASAEVAKFKKKSSDEERIIKREPNDFSNIKSQISNHFQPQNLQIVPPIVHLSQPPPLISSATPKSHYFNSSIPPPLTSNNIQQTIIAPLVQFTPLQSIPQPKPIALNEIPAPKALDLNAIPKPQLDLDAIKIPENKVLSENEIFPTTFEQLIDMVADKGDAFEDKLRSRKNEVHSSLWFLFSTDSDMYKNYRHLMIETRVKRVAQYDPTDIYNEKDDDQLNDSDSDYEYMKETKERNLKNMKRKITTKRDEYSSTDSDEESDHDDKEDSDYSETKNSGGRSRKKKTRWGEKTDTVVPVLTNFFLQNKSEKKRIKQILSSDSDETNNFSWAVPNNVLTTFQLLKAKKEPALLEYARQNFGTDNLNEDDWKKAEEHYKIFLLYQDMLKKRQEIERLAKNGKVKYEYDSDEDVTGGTWEHKLRSAEMEATQVWADALTKQSEGKHHIGDFLPPEELKKFMEKYNAQKNNREPDISDYKEYKLKEDNIGFQMLSKLGWKEGQGLGAGGSGIIDPINKAAARDTNQGLGANSSLQLNDEDNEYEAYRKRMMLAYRFRPNPLNNPRRAYY